MARPVLPIFLASSFVAVACYSSSAPSNAPKGSTAAPGPKAFTEDQNVNVTALYNENCSKCHGERAEGGGGGTRSLLSLEKFDQKHDRAFFDAIKNGVPDMGMESYGSSLSEEAIWGLVVHIRELQGRWYRATKGSSKPDANGIFKTNLHNYKVETVLDEGLDTPWSLDWLPDGRMLVTNRSGSLLLVATDGTAKTVQGSPTSVELGQGGLMEVAVHPDNAKNGWVYLTLADPKQEGRGAMTKVVRGKLKFDGSDVAWTNGETIFEAEQQFYNGAGVHFGSKIAFDKSGHIFFSVGERGGNMLAQQVETPFGKVYRLNDDGSIPADNPFKAQAGSPSHVAGIWTLGHRNQQGLAFDLEGKLWDTEHGPRGGDEFNLIEKGRNYGWPVVAFSLNYNDTPFRTPWPKSGQDIALPTYRWMPSTGASGLDVVDGAAFPKWKGDMLAGGLVGQNVDRIRVKGGKLVEREEILHGMGRVRDIKVSKAGHVYLALNGPDMIVRLVPAN